MASCPERPTARSAKVGRPARRAVPWHAKARGAAFPSPLSRLSSPPPRRQTRTNPFFSCLQAARRLPPAVRRAPCRDRARFVETQCRRPRDTTASTPLEDAAKVHLCRPAFAGSIFPCPPTTPPVRLAFHECWATRNVPFRMNVAPLKSIAPYYPLTEVCAHWRTTSDLCYPGSCSSNFARCA